MLMFESFLDIKGSPDKFSFLLWHPVMALIFHLDAFSGYSPFSEHSLTSVDTLLTLLLSELESILIDIQTSLLDSIYQPKT